MGNAVGLRELDPLQGFFEFRAGGEARQRVRNIASAHVLGIFFPFAAGAQSEGAEIPQIDDVAFGQFLRDDVQHRIQHGQDVGPANGGIIRDALRKLAQVLSPGGMDRWVILFGRIRIRRVTPFDHVKFDSHFYCLLYNVS